MKKRNKKLSGAAVLLFNFAREILIDNAVNKNYWTLPGGGIDENESPQCAAIRECKEEVYLTLKSLNFCALINSLLVQAQKIINFCFTGEC